MCRQRHGIRAELSFKRQRRIAERPQDSGATHHVPSIDIRRRFQRSLGNLRAYVALADEFFLFDASTCPPMPVFSKTPAGTQIENPGTFLKIPHLLELP
jgi:predicted ABC-type ATPase